MVEAEGWAAAVPGDAAGASQRALAEAQRRAVEKVTGLALRASLRVEQAVAVDQRIWSEAAGRIASYEILSELDEGGVHKTRIRAWVVKREPGGRSSVPEALPGAPRVAVAVRGRAAGSALAAERGIRQALKAAGITVAAAPGRGDAALSGEADVAALDPAGLEGFLSYRARVSVEVRDPASGEVLAGRSREASAIDLTRGLAAAKALEEAGRLAGQAVAADLRAAWSAR
jgi:hypothetical protein